jgi:hypothetical protein
MTTPFGFFISNDSLQVRHELLDFPRIDGGHRNISQCGQDVLAEMIFHGADRPWLPVSPRLVVFPAPLDALAERLDRFGPLRADEVGLAVDARLLNNLRA